MNKILKWIVIGLNLFTFYKTYEWYSNPVDPKAEPFIAMISQGSAILLLFFENNIGNVLTKIKNINFGIINTKGNVRIGDKK